MSGTSVGATGTTAENAEIPLTDAYRLLRRVGPPQVPLPGWLARRGDGEIVHLVSAHTLTNRTSIWGGRGEHVLTAADVVRCADGHAIEIPWCRDRLDRFLARRSDDRSPLSAGEAVTVAVSILRGAAEATAGRRHDRPPRGRWWLTESGKPLFLVQEDDHAPDVWAAGVEVLDLAASDAAPAAVRALETAVTGLERREADVEGALFAVAEPRALVLDRGPDPPQNLAPRKSRHDRSHRSTTEERDPIARYVDADVARLGFEAWDRLRARVFRSRRARGGGRRAVWALATAAAGVVLVAGIAWPDGAPEASGELPTAADHVSEPSEPVPASRVEADGWESATDAIIEAWGECAEDACRQAYIDDPARLSPGPDLALPVGERTVTLLDDFGDVAVLRVEAADGPPAQIAVVIRTADALRLRDVYAAQPQ